MKANKILIASHNPHKVSKIKEILKSYCDQIYGLTDMQIYTDVEETADNFKENAEIKALEFSKLFDGYVIATDGGANIPALKEWNGLYTKRFAGENATDTDRINRLLYMMKDMDGTDRKIVWTESVAIAKKGEVLLSEEIMGVEGLIQKTFDESKYQKGIWLCSLLFLPKFNKNFFDLNQNEKIEVEFSWEEIGRIMKAFFARLAQ